MMDQRSSRMDASHYLICFPWAGGGSKFYLGWDPYITDEIELLSVCLPGRDKRHNEPCSSDPKFIVDEIALHIGENYHDKPLYFFGHSLGALLAFMVSLELKKKYNLEPKRLFLSGAMAPHSDHRSSDLLDVTSMSDQDFLDKARELGGTPKELIQDPSLRQSFLPVLRADIQLVNNITYSQSQADTPPLTCPIDYFDGDHDSDHDIQAWRIVTSNPDFTYQQAPGSHFYLKDVENSRKIASFINQRFEGWEHITL